MKTLLKSIFCFSLLGLCFGATALRAQITNPTFAILNLEHYRAYYSFYMLGEQLDSFARLGVLAGILVLTSFIISVTDDLGLRKFLSYSKRGERFSWPWRTLSMCSVLVVGLLWQIGMFVAISVDLVNHDLRIMHHLLLAGLSLIPILCLSSLKTSLKEHRLFRWPLAFPY